MSDMDHVFKTVLPQSGSHKGTSSCKSDGCIKSTREGKPFCSRHITESPYVQRVLGELVKRDREIVQLEKRKSVASDAHLVRETLLLLRMNPYSVKGLARRLDISHDAADALINQICYRKLACKGKTQRGEKRISGLRPPELSIHEK